MSLHTELKTLFGQDVLDRAAQLAPKTVDALAVHEAAGALSFLAGKPHEQLAYVRAMPHETAAALCRWMMEPGFWVMVADVTKH